MSEIDAPEAVRTAAMPDLRRGVWTRLGDDRVLGDDATEDVLGSLAVRTRDAARAQGYAVGWSQGHQAGLRRAAEEAAVAAAEMELREQQRAAEHRTAVAALAAAAAGLEAAASEVAARIGEQATELAMETVTTLLGHELQTHRDPGAAAVARALAVLPRDASVVVRLHPSAAASLAATELESTGVEVRRDPGLEPHDAVVETDTTAVDLRLGQAVARLREVLR